MGFIVIPGTKNEEHILQNADIFDFALTDDEMEKVAEINKNKRYYIRTDSQLEQFKNWDPNFDSQN